MTTRKRRNPKSKIQNPKSQRKRGIVLLIVVSLLAIFILMGVAFALVAMHYQKTAALVPRIEQYGDPPQREAEYILSQLLYGTNGRSSLRGHDLMSDLYGSDGVGGYMVQLLPMPPGPHAINVDLPPGLILDPPQNPPQQPQIWEFAAMPNGSFHTAPGYYAGRVLTFLSGNCAGHSTRITESAYDAANGYYRFRVEAIESKGPTNLRPNFDLSPALNTTFVINGAPFNGVGAGYSKPPLGSGSMTAAYYTQDPSQPPGTYFMPPRLVALLPHFAGYDVGTGGSGYMPEEFDVGGLDESWDAVDFQNMFLAMVTPNAATTPGLPIIPSFHRPELINYWLNNLPTEFQGPPLDVFDPTMIDPQRRDALKNFLRTINFRPMPWDHMDSSGNSSFSGSNPKFDLANARGEAQAWLIANGQPVAEPAVSIHTTRILLEYLVNAPNAPIWDIDNDGDGVPDSIWIDPGLPVVTRPDGRRYKRLVAILVKDLDGRINLNAHGNGSQVATDAGGNYSYRSEFQFPSGGVTSTPINVSRGVGFGPSEVDFLHVFTTATPAYSDTAALSVYSNLLQGRYASHLPGDNGGTAAPGVPFTSDTLSVIKHQGVPNNYTALAPPFLSWYASPPDVWGRRAVVLDYGGQPVTSALVLPGEMTDQPYELTLSGQENHADSPYTIRELERMLRYNDGDIALPYNTNPTEYAAALAMISRPLGIAQPYLATSPPGSVGLDEANRNLFTTHSSRIPAPQANVPLESRGSVYFTGEAFVDDNPANGQYDSGEMYTDSPSGPFSNGQWDPPQAPTGTVTILDVYREKLIFGGVPVGLLPAEMGKLVPWEFMHGNKFNLNRWLGDGFDSSGTAFDAADDPAEAFAGENAWPAPALFATCAAQHTNGMDVNNNNIPNEAIDRFLARALYARHLHCLALAMVPSGFAPAVPTNEGTLSPAQQLELVSRRIAQWAINVVDFRDSDSIMTAYEYDINPWDGWSVDGNPATDGTVGNEEQVYNPVSGNVEAVATGQRRLVWGLEYPDLLITETIAVHDRRVKDTDQDSSGDDRGDMPNDPTLDQFRVPQGSLYFELFCPRNAYGRNPMMPRELYDYSVATNPRLQIGRLSPNGWPVWRMAISRIIGDDETAQQDVHPAQMATTNPESASYDPFGVNLLPGGTPAAPVAIDRFAYFGDASGLPAAALARSFYSSSNANPLVEPGQYVVVGPRITTYLGSQDATDPATAPAPMPAGTLWGGNSRQSIVLNAGGITITDADGNNNSRTPGTDIRPAVPIVCDMPGVTPNTGVPSAPWSDVCPWNIGLNISEPLPGGNYYPEPLTSVTPPGATAADFYADPADPQADPAYLFLNQPVESPGVGTNAGRPIADRGMTESGPYTDCSSAFLQRLANPNVAYNPAPGTDPLVAFNPALPVNPYITVDWATIDLNVFSGEEDSDDDVMGGPDAGQPIDPDDDPANQPNMGVPKGSRQRGYQPTAGVPDSNYWSPLISTPPGDLVGAADPQGAYFEYNLSNELFGLPRQSFGYVNDTVAQPYATPGPNLGAPDVTSGQTSPWLAFHNRPFASSMELLLVPSSSPGRLCSELTPGPLDASIAASPYDDTSGSDPETLRAPFGHLLNLFHSNYQFGGTANDSMQLARILEYVEVPSPYQGAERWYTPSHFTGGPLPHTYHAPFNKASRFRDAGLININTVFDHRILWAAWAKAPFQDRSGSGAGYWDENGTFHESVFQSRQGYGGAVMTTPAPGVFNPLMNADYPTRFANPFRAADASDMMPILPNLPPPTDPSNSNMPKLRPIDATLLRPHPDTTNPDEEPLFAVSAATGHNNTERNPYFRYQGLQKIGSVFTTNSNVFAVWMTVGYFEVEPVSPSAAHPEGWRLGQEIGVDSGEVARHRSFYIIDRSVPVGHLPGQKLNTDECILLRRFIE
jgi:hypothetical protein